MAKGCSTKFRCCCLLCSLILLTIITFIIVVFPRHSTVSTPRILIIGGTHDARGAMELYHPLNPQLNHVLDVKMMQGREHHTSALMHDGTVITVGGYDKLNYTVLSSCECFNPSTKTLTECPSLITGRAGLKSAVLAGVLYVCGGWNEQLDNLESCEQLLSNGWQRSVPMTTPGSSFAMTATSEHLYVIGGWNSDSGDRSAVVRRGANDQQWTAIKSMNIARYAHSATVMKGKIFVCGGLEGRQYESDSCERYDPSLDEWKEIAKMIRGRVRLVLVNDGSHLFAVTGHSPKNTVEMCDTTKNNSEWIVMPKLILEHQHSSAVLIL